ncbi:CoxG family protein [Amycolatopsis jejuensis]|uniref:CoxG family protein n=1 Tax=Amycolatopsis jejuensis TaxID=330084 RepID=UPI000690B594|nr:hypothetical protein [Amycolatopsis jejuensis]
MIIRRSFDLACPAADTYAALGDLERLARSFPEVSGFVVSARVLAVDEASRSVVVRLSGQGAHQAGDAHVEARVSAAPDGSTVDLTADLRLRGMVAQIRVDDLADRFAACLAQAIVRPVEKAIPAAVPESPPASRFSLSIIPGAFAAGALSGYCWARFGARRR